jgi:hypothetical protein
MDKDLASAIKDMAQKNPVHQKRGRVLIERSVFSCIYKKRPQAGANQRLS